MIKSYTLYIDTSGIKETKVSLYDGKKEVRRLVEDREMTSQVIIPLIEKILSEEKQKIEDITSVRVNRGPGSYTGLRVGITVANIIGWLLNKPVNNRKNIPAEPLY